MMRGWQSGSEFHVVWSEDDNLGQLWIYFHGRRQIGSVMVVTFTIGKYGERSISMVRGRQLGSNMDVTWTGVVSQGLILKVQ